MKTRAATARVLARSSQPRRRLARRRQQLPNPVLRSHRTAEVVARTIPVDARKLLIVPVELDLQETTTSDVLASSDSVSDAVGSI
jgi:hypothetical protein